MSTHSVMKMACGCVLALSAWTAWGQEAVPSLIVRADDMGSFRAANIACMEAYKNGIETSIEVMVVTPWFPEAARLLRENPGIDVGLHLTITSEWDNIKWRPLTSCPSLVDSNGYFFPMMTANPNYPGLSIMENKWNIDEVEREFRAQIEMALKNIPQISHISGHMGSTGFDPQITELMRRLAKEYNLPAIDRVSAMEEYDFSYAGYDGAHKTFAEKEASFIKMLNKLEPGKNYMFIDHPALDNEEMQTVGHIGYENVAEDRQGVTDLFMSPKVKAAIQERNIDSECVKVIKSDPTVDAESGELYVSDGRGTAEEKYEQTLRKYGGISTPNYIAVYAKDFDAKAEIKEVLDAYNDTHEEKIVYTDLSELMGDMLSSMVDVISYVLIGFTAISLIVSSVMIGIITYVSVIERTKEIGILRAIGARKKDIARVFNAETFIIGFFAGLVGVVVAAILTVPVNAIISVLAGVGGIASLNVLHCVILIAVSICLTLISGLIPASKASRKDPVTALRTE